MSVLARGLAALALLLAGLALGLHLVFPAPGAPTDRPQPVPTPEALSLPRMRAQLRDELAAAGRRPAWSEAALAAIHLAETADGRPAAPRLGELHAPLRFRATAQEGGIRLSWLPNPENPVEGMRYRLTRWAGEGASEVLAETEGLEHFDAVDCEGLTYHYRLRALRRTEILPGQLATRESPTASASAELPRRASWSVSGLDTGGRPLLVWERPERAPQGPFPAIPGSALGGSGWYLESLLIRETKVQVSTRIPRFDALGRRVIIGGRPADRIREGQAERLLASARLTDPCGTLWNLEFLLPEGAQVAGANPADGDPDSGND